MTEAPVAAMPTIAVDGLEVAYVRGRRPLAVLHDVSFAIAPGEAYGLVGESGCGKSTVAMALMRYLPENAVVGGGTIRFDGRDVLAADARTLRGWRGSRMAMVYQDPATALNPSMRVGDQIAEVYRHHAHMSGAASYAAAARMLETMQIASPVAMLRRYPHELSGGQQQRVMLAMALATDPELLILDEPTTGLDATVEAEVLDLVEDLRERLGTAILFVSHNLGIVARLCDRVGVLYAGRIVEEGPARTVFADPRHPYTHALLGCRPRLGMRKGADPLEPIAGSLPPLGAEIAGCVYADRCPLAQDRCLSAPPALVPVDAGHEARCFFHERVPDLGARGGRKATPGAVAGATPATVVAPGARTVALEDIVRVYRTAGGDIRAVDRVSRGIGRGEVLGLVGESGSGKTTLARCLAGLVDPTEGRVTVEGTPVAGLASARSVELRRRIQMIFQNPDDALNPRRTVRRILRRTLRVVAGIRSGSEQERRAGLLATSVRLEPRHLELRPAALSGGLKQRVAIARAFAGSPELVICDEPTSALDVSVQAAILNLLVELQRADGVSYLFISHDLAVVGYVADRIAVMYLGQVVDEGPAAAVFAAPHHPYTEALLSAVPTLALGARTGRVRLRGGAPSAFDPPTGCRFHPRCPRFLGSVCREVPPPIRQAPDGNAYRCHIPPDELAGRQATPPTD